MGGRIRNPARAEVATTGFDPFRQLDPDGSGTPSSTGLYVPALATTYLFLLAVVDLDPGDAIVGLRQYLDLVALLGSGEEKDSAPWYPILQPLGPGDARWRFVDGGDTWVLTRETKVNRPQQQGPWDQDSFVLRDAGTSALVYETAAFGGALFPPGYGSLTAYTPPAILGHRMLQLRDRRFPWDAQSNLRLRYEAQRPERWRLYCQLTQTDPATRNNPSVSPGGGYVLTPPEGFVQTFPALAQYGWVAGSIIYRRAKRGIEACSP